MKSLPFSAVLCLCITLALQAIELHVAPEHVDSVQENGSRKHPFLTIQDARDAIRLGRKAGQSGPWVVHIHKGFYPLREPVVFEPQDSGTVEAPIIYKGEGAKSSRICGGLVVTGWHVQPDGSWIANIPNDANGKPAFFEQLFVAGRRAQRARHPNTGFFNPKEVKQSIDTNKHMAQATIVGRANDLAVLTKTPPTELRFAQVVVHHKWDTTRRIIAGFDADQALLTTQGGAWKHWNKWQTNSLYYVENVRAALDTPGEWFYDGVNGKLQYLPLKGEHPDRTEIVAPYPGLKTMVVFNGDPANSNFVTQLTFEDIGFLYSDSPRRVDQVRCAALPAEIAGDLYTPGPTQFEPHQAASHTDAAIVANGAHQITFRNCDIAHTGEYGIWFQSGCVSNRIEHCAITDLGAGGIRIGNPDAKNLGVTSNSVFRPISPYSTAYNIVDNCIITHGGRFHASGTAVWIGHSCDNQITHCEISDHFYTGISVGWVWGYSGSAAQRNTIAFNRIHKIGQHALGDMGGIYTLGTSFGTCISNNVLFDIDSYTYGGWGLYPDEGSEGLVLENNLVYDTKDGSFHQHYGRNNILRNNILCFSRECQVAVTRVEKHRSLVVERNIIVWKNAPNFSDTRYTHTIDAKVDWLSNLWWRIDGPSDFKGMTFAQWQEMGRDVDGLVADPLFKDSATRDFRLEKGSPAKKIGFQPFDSSKAGVYGKSAWRRRARQ